MRWDRLVLDYSRDSQALALPQVSGPAPAYHHSCAPVSKYKVVIVPTSPLGGLVTRHFTDLSTI